MNKPFLLLAGDDHYPCRGVGDWIDRFATYEEAEERIGKGVGYNTYYEVDGRRVDWYEIVNLETWGPNQ